MSKPSTIAMLLLFLLSSPVLNAASCPNASSQIYVAAVVGPDKGGIFQLHVQTRPGNGNIYTSIFPRTGIATQESEENAVKAAFSSAGISSSDCDVFFSITGNLGEQSLDGPSAGAAMAVATSAALTGKPIRQDVVMTGTISPEGKVGEIGGAIEKSVAASLVGAKYMVLPKIKVYEALLISSLGTSRDFSAIEVENLSGAQAIFFSNYSQNFTRTFSPRANPIPYGLETIEPDPELQRFSKVAQKVVDSLEDKSNGALEGQGKNSEQLKSYFSQEISNFRKLLSMGYPFTAANSAFLLSIDAEYLKVGESPIDINGSMQDVQECIKSISHPAKTLENFHWATGSDLRSIWAQEKISQTAQQASIDSSTLRDLLYSYSWCGISKDLGGQAIDIGGLPADESSLSSLAIEKLSEAQQAVSSSSHPDFDASWHLQNGIDANKSGLFGAAIYEATYAISMQEATDDQNGNITAAIEKLSSSPRQSLWGKIYFGQGMYLKKQSEEEGFPPTDAYRILKYSYELDRVSSQIDRELAAASSRPPAPIGPVNAKTSTQTDFYLFIFLALCVAALGFAALYRVAKINLTRERIFIK